MSRATPLDVIGDGAGLRPTTHALTRNSFHRVDDGGIESQLELQIACESCDNDSCGPFAP